eukprot:6197774-Pleurochrysis_carterae.AAC.3
MAAVTTTKIAMRTTTNAKPAAGAASLIAASATVKPSSPTNKLWNRQRRSSYSSATQLVDPLQQLLLPSSATRTIWTGAKLQRRPRTGQELTHVHHN